MSYKAFYHIKHGESNGFSLKHDSESEERREFISENEEKAYKSAMIEANKLAMDYLSDSSGFTTVTLTSFQDSIGREINQVELLRKLIPNVSDLEGRIKNMFPEGRLQIKKNWMYHALAALS